MDLGRSFGQLSPPSAFQSVLALENTFATPTTIVITCLISEIDTSRSLSQISLFPRTLSYHRHTSHLSRIHQLTSRGTHSATYISINAATPFRLRTYGCLVGPSIDFVITSVYTLIHLLLFAKRLSLALRRAHTKKNAQNARRLCANFSSSRTAPNHTNLYIFGIYSSMCRAW